MSLLWKIIQQFLKKLKIEYPIEPSRSTFGLVSKSGASEIHCIALFTAALFTVAKTRKEPMRALTEEQISKT